MNDIISSSKIKKDEILYRAHYLRKGAGTCKYGTRLCHTCNFITCNTFHDSLKQHVMKSDKKKLQVYTRLTAQDLHVYTTISNVIFFSAFLDIIIIITVIEVNILYFLVNVFYKQPNKSLRLMTPWLNSQ